MGQELRGRSSPVLNYKRAAYARSVALLRSTPFAGGAEGHRSSGPSGGRSPNSILFGNGSYRQLPPESCLSVPHQNQTLPRRIYPPPQASPSRGNAASSMCYRGDVPPRYPVRRRGCDTFMMDVKNDLGPSSFKRFDRGYSTTNSARTREPAVPHNINYELLIEIELALASRATDGERRRHLDQAAVYATLGEKYCGSDARNRNPAWINQIPTDSWR